jgi:hypothetical protein
MFSLDTSYHLEDIGRKKNDEHTIRDNRCRAVDEVVVVEACCFGVIGIDLSAISAKMAG